MKKQKPERKRQDKLSQFSSLQRPEDTEFGEEFTFDQKRQQPTNLDNKERRNHRK